MSALIYQLPTQITGFVGIYPNPKFMVTGDNLATITTAGYLNQVDLESNPISTNDILNVLYSYNLNTQVGTYEQFTVGITNGVITLTQASFAGEVTLPTTANHIATYTNTGGGLGEDPTTAITAGNLQAGLSGTAGALYAYPATALKGHLALAAVANTGNTVTTISNDAMGQASVMSIPDPGNAAGQFLVGATATPFVSGNFPKNSGTAGLMVDSGVSVSSLSSVITQVGSLYQVAVTLTPTQMAAAYATPQTLIANPLSSQMILVHFASVYTASTGNTAYATGTAPIIQYSSGGTNGAHGLGTLATASGLVAGDITASTSQVRNLYGLATNALTGLSGLGIYFSNATGAYTGGTGTNVTFTLVYELLTATV